MKKISHSFLGRLFSSKNALDDANAGWEASKRGDLDEAIRLYSRAIVSGKLTTENRVTVLHRRGIAWISMNNADLAVDDFNEAIRLNPLSAETFSCRATAWAYKQDFDRSIDDYNQAIKLNPQLAEAFCGRSNIRRFQNDFAGAIADLNEALRLGENAMYFYSRGNVWHDMKDCDRAIADYTEAIRHYPLFAEAYYSRGDAWISKDECSNKENYDRAVSDYKEAIRIDPATARVSYLGGNGTSLEEAIIIKARGTWVGIQAENAWMEHHYPSFQKDHQRLLHNEEKHYDEIHITTNSAKKIVYFDITDFYGKL